MNLTDLRRTVDFWMAEANQFRTSYPHAPHGPKWDAIVDGAVGAIGRLIEEDV